MIIGVLTGSLNPGPNGEFPAGPQACIVTSGQREPTPSDTCQKGLLLELNRDHLPRPEPVSKSHSAICPWAERQGASSDARPTIP